MVGTPQFEPYADASLLWPREEFFRRIGADPSRPLICYSGGDAGTCPEDPEHVRILMELVRAGRIEGNPQVLVRPVPVDEGKRYARVQAMFPEMIFRPPEWVHPEGGNWAAVMPTAGDVQFLANLTHHADLNINLGSTMTLDFGLHDKPVVNVAFDVADPPLFGLPVWDYYYQFEHYRPVVELGAARFARSPGAACRTRERVPARSFARPRGTAQAGRASGRGAHRPVVPAHRRGAGADRKAVKICFVCNEYPPARHGGIGVFTRMLAVALARAGHDVRVIGACRPQPGLPGESEEDGVRIWRLPRQTGRVSWISARYGVISTRARLGPPRRNRPRGGSGL